MFPATSPALAVTTASRPPGMMLPDRPATIQQTKELEWQTQATSIPQTTSPIRGPG
jgi:hypothetical protein